MGRLFDRCCRYDLIITDARLGTQGWPGGLARDQSSRSWLASSLPAFFEALRLLLSRCHARWRRRFKHYPHVPIAASWASQSAFEPRRARTEDDWRLYSRRPKFADRLAAALAFVLSLVRPMDADKVFKALADPTRRKLLDLLCERNNSDLVGVTPRTARGVRN